MEYSFLNNNITPCKIADTLTEMFECYVPVIVCVGTDATIGDTLGPLVGTKLMESKANCYVYGNLSATITAKEVPTIKKFLASVHPLAKILVVDAAVGIEDDVGKIKLYKDGIFPGLGADKNLPKLGDGSIIGIVSPRSKNNMVFMNFTRFSPIYKMAETISQGILQYVDYCNQLSQVNFYNEGFL